MKAMALDRIGAMTASSTPLRLTERHAPSPRAGQVRIRVNVCGVCRTELDEIEGRLPPAHLPRTLGHQVVGDVDEVGDGVDERWRGVRVGVAWAFETCGECTWCRTGLENLCPRFVATGRDVDGGYAEFIAAPVAFVHRLPASLGAAEAAPLLCAGAIGWRSLKLTGIADGEPLGLMGFGASGHLVLSMARARYPQSRIHVFARNPAERALAHDLGATSAGDVADASPEPLAAIIDTTPAWTPVVRALEHLAPGGRLVINAIRKDDADRHALLRLDYARHLWMEKTIRSVANVTRADVRECLELADRAGIRPEVTSYGLAQANDALRAIKLGEGRGARILQIR